jgi:probable rRNA maturation factor
MIHIEITAGLEIQVDPSLLEGAAAGVLAYLGMSGEDSLTILITGDQKIQELNRQFRGVDAPTDVLAFPAGHADPESGGTYLGDVVISFPQALNQAAEAGHPVQAEIQLLVVHGVLHLVGYDHGEPEGKAEMWAAQRAILEGLGLLPDIIDVD